MWDKIIAIIKKGAISHEEKLFFIQHLALMLKSGISLPNAVSILSKQGSNSYFRKVLSAVHESLVKGNSLQKSLSLRSEVFPKSLIGMVKVGEAKGDLASVLNAYYQLLKRQKDIKSKARSAMIYPSVVMAALVVMGILSVMYIFPRIIDIVEQIEGTMPTPTRVAIGISNFLVNHGILVIFLLIVALVVFFFFKETKRGKITNHFLLLHIPIIKDIVKDYNLALLTRNFGSLLKSGIPIGEALETTASTLGNVFYQQSLYDARDQVNSGKFVKTAFLEYPKIYPDVILQIITVGEESGILDEMLVHIAEFYEEKVTNTLASLTSIIEPLIILVLGVAVAFIALSILLPIYSISSFL